jgi:type I restriction-modification system DNA methylase subunit
MVAGTNSARELLEAAYTTLGLDKGELLSAAILPTDETTLEQWLDKGDWLSLAKKVGAEKIFFVEDDPVIVFARAEAQDTASLRKIFNDVWCMARPQRLFIARDGELAVYDLTKPPIQKDEEWRENKPLAVAKRIADVARELKNYHREIIESGKLFEEERFGKDDQRADQSLIRDLKRVRAGLTDSNSGKELERKYAHALIGRSIFIRYLEDRKILTRDYFENVAIKHNKPEWQLILNASLNKSDIDQDMEKLLYPRVLDNKEFTYALFDQLSEDFNGDMFPSDSDERKAVDIQHLKLLQGFLRGDVGTQQNLFFWAYKFDIIPIELISSIYEEFYLTSNADTGNHGTHYTPSSLVRFVLSQVLTPKCLERNPRVLDPCCGSGIFLVEAFRRIVRYRVYQKHGKRLSSKELRKIIRDQLAGIEINEEAVRIAAFSLYLALLHFQEPPAIWKQIEKGQRLPGLKYQENSSGSGEKFNNLIEANAFDISGKVSDSSVLSKFNKECADVIVGNPPWGQPKRGDRAGADALQKALVWCKQRGYPVGDKERSQAFIWRTLNLLKDGGVASLLVSTGVFFKHQPNSQKFRNQWLESIKLIEVINFSHVRDIFFSGAISPFASVVFQKTSEVDAQYQVVNYFSAKKSAQATRLKSVVLSHSDLQRIRQIDLLENDKLWKIYWWGNHRDLALICVLDLNPTLKSICDLNNTGWGFSAGDKSQASNWLSKYMEMPTENITRYGNLNLRKLRKVPLKVERRGKSEGLYCEKRILVKRGISQTSSPKGQIIARLESDQFCFRNSIYCVKFVEPDDWKYKIVLAILWSSLARYYFFLTTSTWGLWHHEIHYEELLSLPIRFPDTQEKVDNLVRIVDELTLLNHSAPPDTGNELQLALDLPDFRNQLDEMFRLERQLDEAVFDLYELRTSERDLIHDMCDVGIDFFYNEIGSDAIKPITTNMLQQKYGTLQTLSSATDSNVPPELKDYLTVFLNTWNRKVYPEGEFSWRVVVSDQAATMVGLSFSTQEIGYLPQPSNNDEDAWAAILNELDDTLLVPYKSSHIYIDGIVRAVTDTEIIVVKRNERRLWTKSMAREDAEATLLQAMNLQESRQRISS